MTRISLRERLALAWWALRATSWHVMAVNNFRCGVSSIDPDDAKAHFFWKHEGIFDTDGGGVFTLAPSPDEQ